MSQLAAGFWERAKKALLVAKAVAPLDPDTAASRAYYSAMYAVSAHFALRGQTFRKHSAIEAAVHRELVKTGLWPAELGEKYSLLSDLRGTGDYGALDHVTPDEAQEAVAAAAEVLRAVSQVNPQVLTE